MGFPKGKKKHVLISTCFVSMHPNGHKARAYAKYVLFFPLGNLSIYFYSILTSVAGRRSKLLYHRGAKQLLIILVHTVHQVTGVAPQRRGLRGECSNTPVLVPSVKPFKQVSLKIQAVGTGP